MHIEKNMSESLINTFMGTTEKSKDNLNSRLDHWGLGIRSDLHPVEVDDQFYLPPAPYTMSPDEKKLFCQILKGVKFPDGYASNIRHNIQVNEKKNIWAKESWVPHYYSTLAAPCCEKNIAWNGQCKSDSYK